MIFLSTTCFITNCNWFQQYFYLKQICSLIKYRSPIFRKYIIHFIVNTLIFWKFKFFYITIYHKNFFFVFNCTILIILYSQSRFALLYTSSPISFDFLNLLSVNRSLTYRMLLLIQFLKITWFPYNAYYSILVLVKPRLYLYMLYLYSNYFMLIKIHKNLFIKQM